MWLVRWVFSGEYWMIYRRQGFLAVLLLAHHFLHSSVSKLSLFLSLPLWRRSSLRRFNSERSYLRLKFIFIWESVWLISRERSVNRFKIGFSGEWHYGAPLRIWTLPGEGGGRGRSAKWYDHEKAWPSINHSILSGFLCLCLTVCIDYRHRPKIRSTKTIYPLHLFFSILFG